MCDNLAYQEARREERIGGRLVAMSPRPSVNHNRIAFNISYLFERYLRRKRCTPFADGTDLYLTGEEQYIPDFMVVCDPDKIKPNGVYGAPDLVAEVLSPGTAKYDRGHKMEVYARCGVREYWLVSPEEKSVEQYLLRDGAYELNAVHTLYPGWMLEKMTEQERAEVETQFKCSLFDDLDISIEDIFYRTF